MSTTSLPRALVVEDEELLARVVERLLTSRGLAVDVAGHGGEAIEKLGSTRYRLVVTDLMMPVLDGEQLVRWMREEAALDTPVIVLSAIRDARQRERLEALGVSAILHKPLDMDDFLQRAVDLAGGDA
ncbi:response regulator receiver protein [Azoarcus sp. CIB]|uniref:response regulator n=1 Tax=Aromatoleum sp. (strain CIB) TaxID=198107 RepID=UPI00067BFC36|nr:response regulator [Azoarcus sp. CIB]AKU10103.1 response regulator receiver protein [Azoarcus sp. CIB]